MNIDHKKALLFATEDKWEESHDIVQDGSDELSCLIHGYLHRLEGDLFNARYWYNRANSDMPDNTVDEELERLVALTE